MAARFEARHRVCLHFVQADGRMAYNHGQPLITGVDGSSHTHALLNHPIALPTDSRIVAACDLLLLRGKPVSRIR